MTHAFRPGQKAKVVRPGHEFEGEEVTIEFTDCEGERSLFAHLHQEKGGGQLKLGRKYSPEDLAIISNEQQKEKKRTR